MLKISTIPILSLCAGIILIWYPFEVKATTAENWVKAELTANYIETLETTPWGILAGEKDTRIQYSPFNGIYKSKDFGQTWSQFALKDRGINSIKYSNGVLFATTYYTVDNKNGLFISGDKGITWNQTGPKVSTSEIAIKNDNVLLGTYSHGLWLSNDGGNTWQQKIGDGYTGPQVYAILLDNNLAIVSLATTTFISKDNCQTWQEIIPLRNLRIRHIAKIENYIFVGTDNVTGIKLSTNDGATWNQNITWSNKHVEAMTTFKNVLYAANGGEIYKTYDFGNTWIPTYLGKTGLTVYSITAAYGNPTKLLSSVRPDGTYIADFIEEIAPDKFLDIPWNYLDTGELIKKVYSFFDHEFPLLGYFNFVEANEYKDTTLNFLGIKNKQPDMYYSSHDGIDFALPFGTQILAAYDGAATYNFDKFGLGHYITITHPNGYKTIYAHLQNEGLIINNSAESINITKSTTIGKVGMSGNTTGPHLHFALQKIDSGKPENRIDPFGWLSHNLTDPWNLLLWQDNNGIHQGPKSYDFWVANSYLQEDKSLATVLLDNEVTDNSVSLFVRPYSIPNKNTYSKNLNYIEGSSTIIEIVNLLGESIKTFSKKLKVVFNLNSLDLSNVDETTLRIYHFNEDLNKWERISSFFNPETKIIEGETDHLSWFAVFGNSKDTWKKTVRMINSEFSFTK